MKNNIPLINFENLYASDPIADAFWELNMGEPLFPQARPHLHSMGRLAAAATPLSFRADQQGPKLKTHSPNGEPLEQVEYHPDYLALQEAAYGGRLIQLKFDTEFRKSHNSIRHRTGFAMGFYFAQTEIGLYCPVCMTDGVARVLERHGQGPICKETIERLSSAKLDYLWQGAMFLTEKQGGSDVGANLTQATQTDDGWTLNGEKWFCSNVDAEAILALARMPGEPLSAGTRGLGLFLILRHRPEENFRGLHVLRIKDKLGVRSMPTGEVKLENVKAHLIAGAGQGFKVMAEMLNLSRLYNSVASLAGSRRALLEALAYGFERRAFGRRLWDLPLWRAGMADLAAEHLGARLLVFSTVRYLDEADNGNPESEYMVRLLTPVTKAITGKFAIFAASEAMEAIGGNAYIEESILPRILRDCQVLPIWEGTTNILALDALRVIQKYGESLFYSEIQRLFNAGRPYASAEELQILESRVKKETALIIRLKQDSSANQERGIRHWVEEAARTFTLAALLQARTHPGLSAVTKAAFSRLAIRPIPTAPLGCFGAVEMAGTEEILMNSAYATDVP